jgi:inner membrane protein
VPTIVTHAVVGAALARIGPRSVSRGRLAVALAALSVLPDLDVAAFQLGIPYSHWLGHRGLTHSLPFAICAAALTARFAFRPLRSRDAWHLFALCSLAMASHGVLDAFTDGGLGIAFFLPFSASRYFFPYQPLVVSPIGLQGFLRGPAFTVLASEVVYVWLPLLAALAVAPQVGWAARRVAGARLR